MNPLSIMTDNLCYIRDQYPNKTNAHIHWFYTRVKHDFNPLGTQILMTSFIGSFVRDSHATVINKKSCLRDFLEILKQFLETYKTVLHSHIFRMYVLTNTNLSSPLQRLKIFFF